jgi:RNA polymerase sigma-70 factor (ECF subfamily)
MEKSPAVASLRDAELAARAAAGSRAAFEELVTRYAPRLFLFLRARSESAEDVEDLVQETFLRAFRKIDRYDPRWKFSTWLYTLAFRLAVSRWRSQGPRLAELDPETPACPSPGPPEILIQKEEARRHGNIWSLARTLSRNEYDALWLRYAEGMPAKEIARALKKREAGVRALLHRGRVKLAKKMSSRPRKMSLAEEACAGHNTQFCDKETKDAVHFL